MTTSWLSNSPNSRRHNNFPSLLRGKIRRIRMKNLHMGNPAGDQVPKPLPSHAALLTPPPKRAVPVPNHLGSKAFQTVHVAGNSMVVEVALNDPPQPPPDLGHWHVPAPMKLLFHFVQLCGESLLDRPALDGEPAGLPGLPADMREAQEVERFRLALAPLLPVFGCVAPEFDQARLVRVEFQPELPHTLPPCLEEPLGIGSLLESQNNVVGVPNDDNVAPGMMLSPVLRPKVEGVVEVYVREQRRGHRPLRGTYFRP